MNRKGFSLIELLLVIAIIGIISAVVAPTFIRARDRARVSEVASQLVADLERARSSSRRSNKDAAVAWTNGSGYTLTSNGQTFTRTFPSGVTVTMPNASPITYKAPLGERTAVDPLEFTVGRTGKTDVSETVAVLGVTGKVYRK